MPGEHALKVSSTVRPIPYPASLALAVYLRGSDLKCTLQHVTGVKSPDFPGKSGQRRQTRLHCGLDINNLSRVRYNIMKDLGDLRPNIRLIDYVDTLGGILIE